MNVQGECLTGKTPDVVDAEITAFVDALRAKGYTVSAAPVEIHSTMDCAPPKAA